ncbi:hypothetical protein Xcel_2929 [Xylanimonas cellulosilytica DSM 15894]|uniref:DUF3027 domain-containing protein n=1 Tax=Xylanimonas cellulosilytica (strain DSM 15894 / JCM 12276 / CECT 5975 / KCTC 9989 / LMG 20990 / NBRC 107835 / XIL07) TaxID=446471 RepID=D1BZ39_XYLCX|nr:DUF3027 domain-containing protein [Xylanimonas cellulosilytica]ACZ31936.1 hypothetical protein Xcel_2929 [Xylanimonas cellulosilytica DSM 15894]
MTAAQAAARPRRTTRPTKEVLLVGAVELARAAAVEVAESASDVGEHVGAVVDGERLVSHRFAAAMAGYQGWSWVVTLARVPRGRNATVCEVELLPGDGALLAPDWLPWSERLRPGDIGPGDTLPFKADDPRLEPGWEPTGDPEQDEVAIDELALARTRVLSPTGRAEAAQRWYRGSRGPTAAGAVRSPAECLSCGFLIPLAGELGQLFGVCANEWSPDDGKVVSLDHGCGAHSETDVEPGHTDWPAADPLIDETTLELVDLPAPPPTPVVEPVETTPPVVEPTPVAEPVETTPLTDQVVEPVEPTVPVVEPVETTPPADSTPTAEAPPEAE